MNCLSPRVYHFVWVVLLLLVTSTGCSDTDFSSTTDYETVITMSLSSATYDYDPTTTFYLEDEIFPLLRSDMPPDSLSLAFDSTISAAVSKAVVQEMTDKGFIQTDHPDDADLTVTMYVVSHTAFSYTGTYHFFQEPDMRIQLVAPDHPLHYAGSGVIILITDKDIKIDTATYQAIWTCGIHGVLSYPHAAPLLAGIQQAFNQSPYLAATEDSQ